jgi:hypothetical protein
MKREWIALVILGGLISLAVLAVGFGWRRQEESMLLRASMPEAGGWEPAAIQLSGQPLPAPPRMLPMVCSWAWRRPVDIGRAGDGVRP